ncbi:MAG: hypothetical protein KBC36_06820 [Spirochaetia bacterium]|nr:hypothetical protein [Spirochaetia bacterium]
MRASEALGKVARGYLAALRTGAGLAIAVVLAGCLSALVAWPLWLAATSNPRAYALSIMVLAGAALVLASARSRAAARRAGAPRADRLGAARSLALAGCALAALPALALAARLPWLGVPLVGALVLAAGLALFARSAS